MLIIIHVFFCCLSAFWLDIKRQSHYVCISLPSLPFYTFSFHLVSFLFYTSDLNSYHYSFIPFFTPFLHSLTFFYPFPARYYASFMVHLRTGSMLHSYDEKSQDTNNYFPSQIENVFE